MANARIAESCTLPSHGQIYEETIDPNIILSSMKCKHEMRRLNATDNYQKLMAGIIDECLQTDIGLSSYDLCLGDFQYLLYKLRIITYGPDYEMTAFCPYCGFENYLKVNLDDLEINEFDETLLDLLTFTSPTTKDEIKFTLQTPRTIDKINDKCKEYRKRHKDSNENPTLLYTILYSIEEWNGETPNLITLEEKIKELPMADTNAIINRIDEINSKIGVDLMISDECVLCKTGFTVPFRVNDDFFRPRNN